MDSYDKLDNLIEIAGKNAKHNLTTKQIEALASRYLSDDVDFKTSQLKGSDDYLNGIYYYNPSVKSIQKYSNILRSDLGLSKITDKDDFLDERVIKHYGSLVPLTELEESLLRKIKKTAQLQMMIRSHRTKIIQLIKLTINKMKILVTLNTTMMRIIKVKLIQHKRINMERSSLNVS